ncbi:MAG: AbrB/MazE/SpoVT family DNA-binding domain-containing protein [Oscillospiraceae bacterium]|nr:AbrB/MazE/SpoVT family DNA-binding domain-containing protein [Oscillospiraceae bacterium]
MGLIKYKKLSKVRGVTVPKDLAANLGMFAGAAVDLVETSDGILLRKHVPTCVFCGSVESVDTVKGKEICAKCAREMREEINSKYA